jgi:uncharacterized membrane protein
MTHLKSVTLASAAAIFALTNMAVVSSASAAPKDTAAKVAPCYGVNSCKGQSDCKSGNHDCKGMNDCKGQGFKALTSSACKTAGGTLTVPQ